MLKPTLAVAPARGTRSPPAAPRTILDPIITMDSGGIIQSASDSIEHVFGWTPTELFGRNVKMLIPEPRRSALDRYLDRYRNADRAPTLERARRFEAVRKDGKFINIELAMSRADLPMNTAPYFIGIIRDVSASIDIGPDTESERARLQHLITEQTRALATANLRLQLADRLTSLGTLAAGLGHDMNNVLLPVRARLNAIEHAGVTDKTREHIHAVRKSIAYLQHLSNGLHFLAMDPDGPGIAPGSEGVTSLAEWWDQVGPLLRKAVPDRIKVVAALSANLPLVHIAPHWLTQAMLNLIVNAGEAMPPRRRLARIRVSAAVTSDGRAVRLSVADNGRGMTPAIQRRAFDLFFTTKARGMGTGLGLPLTQKVALRAGGSVDVASTPGRGTTVTLIIPTANRAKRRGSTKQATTASVSVKDHRAAALITQILTAAGVHVIAGTAAGPGDADLWVTMPSPQTLAQTIRWRKSDRYRCVVLLGLPTKATASRWATAACGTVITIDPPNDFEAMRHAIGEAIHHVSQRPSKGRTS